MKIKSRQAHVSWFGGNIEPGKDQAKPRGMRRLYPARLSRCKEPFQPLVPEAPYRHETYPITERAAICGAVHRVWPEVSG
jgi:hypothetical protein